MPRILYLFIISLLLSCNNTNKSNVVSNEADIKIEINEVLDLWHKNAAETNFDAYFNAMSQNSIFIGTDASEVWSVADFKAFSKPYFDRGKAWEFTSVARNIYVDADAKLVWFDELLDTWMGVCRGSGVLKKNETGWLIEHYVLSVTIPNETIDDVIAINKERDSIFLQNLRAKN